jgi:hypothetical protein
MLGRLLALALALAAWGQISAASAQVEVTLAEEKARRIFREVERVDVRSIPGKYRGIRVYALDGTAVDINKIDIRYADGSVFTECRDGGPPGGCRNIRLDDRDVRTRLTGPDNGNGPEKFIDEIVLYYKTAPGEPRQARVRITGITSSSGAKALRPEGSRPIAVGPGPGPGPGGPGPKGTVTVAPGDKAATGNIAVAPAGSAPAGGDVLFGVQNVGFLVDRDVIKIGSEYGKFDKVRFRVLDNDVFINDLRIIYGNGEADTLAVNANVPANSRTRWFTLKGDRFIKEIQIVYKSRPGFKGQARIEAYGEYAEGWYGPGPSSTPGATAASATPAGEAFRHGSNRGWLYLGGQQPKFISLSLKKGIGYETDIISVARNWGFNRMRLDIKDRAITLNKLTVVYGDGTTDTIPVGQKVDGGSSYGPVQLNRKPIKEIQISYRSRVFDKNATSKAHAFVEFWAQ